MSYGNEDKNKAMAIGKRDPKRPKRRGRPTAHSRRLARRRARALKLAEKRAARLSRGRLRTEDPAAWLNMAEQTRKRAIYRSEYVANRTK